MRRDFRDEAGQLLPFVAIMVAAFLLVTIFVTGAAAAYIVRTRVQAAADAASMAGANQARLWEELAVQRHEYSCFPTKHGWSCSDSGWEQVPVRGLAAQLFPTGWMTDAGCQWTSDHEAGIPPRPNPAIVCDSWQLESAGFEFPSGSDPQGAAESILQQNMARMESHGVQVQVLSLTTSSTSGRVALVVEAVEPTNPLSIFGRGPLRVVVRAGSQRHLNTPLRQHS